MEASEVLEEARKSVRPKRSGILAAATKIVGDINKLLDGQGYDASASLGGSVAKGTFLEEDHDIDIFVRFGARHREDDLSKLLGKAIAPLNPERVHGSRDYFQLKSGFNIEIVPVLRIENPDEALNVTDMSPKHVDWVKKHLGSHPEFADDIRLAKKFCKAADAYGAESFIGGFSGHVLDILIIHYGSFLKLLQASRSWKGKEVIDTLDSHKGDAIKNMNAAKVMSPIIVVDPILPERNAAAALTGEKLDRFKEAAAKFLERPALGFFQRKPFSLDAVKDTHKGKQVIAVEADPKDGKTDVVGGKLMKAFEHIVKQLVMNDFEVSDSGWNWDRENAATFWFVLPEGKLSEEKLVMGPPVAQKKHADEFKAKHPNAYEEKDRLYSKEKRRFREARELVASLLNSEYVKTRVSGARIV